MSAAPVPDAAWRLPERIAEWESFYRRHLLEFIVPFWTRHAIDREHGGVFSCIDDAGKIQSTEKYMWSQCRGLWTFSALYRRMDRRSEWLEIARGLYDFCRRFGPDPDGAWRFRVSREGVPIEGATSIGTDFFAIMGLVEYAQAIGSDEPLDLARRTHQRLNARIRSGQPFPTAPYVMPPEMKRHGAAMQASLVFYELGELLGDPQILADSAYFTRQILREFIRPEWKAVVEYINRDGSFSDTPPGRTVVPGHGIECMWFQLEIFRRSGQTADVARVLEALEWCLQRGWDSAFGGLLLGTDVRGIEPPFWHHPTVKAWWPVTEALAATLMAYEADRDERWIAWHRRIMDWALARYPVREHGEWRQRLTREGLPMAEFIALPVKDPFHLPRGLLIGIETLRRIADRPRIRD